MKRLFVLLILCLSSQVYAQNRIPLTEADFFLQAQYGANFSSKLNTGSYEFAAGYRMFQRFPQVFAGLTYQSQPAVDIVTVNNGVSVSNSDRVTQIGGLLYYHFQEENSGWIAGAKAGISNRFQWNGYYFEPSLQYHYPLYDFLTVGIEASYNMNVRPFTAASAVVQYWF